MSRKHREARVVLRSVSRKRCVRWNRGSVKVSGQGVSKDISIRTGARTQVKYANESSNINTLVRAHQNAHLCLCRCSWLDLLLSHTRKEEKRYLLIHKRSDQGPASTFHAKAERLGARVQRQATPIPGHIIARSRGQRWAIQISTLPCVSIREHLV